jgi:hypothetical protein
MSRRVPIHDTAKPTLMWLREQSRAGRGPRGEPADAHAAKKREARAFARWSSARWSSGAATTCERMRGAKCTAGGASCSRLLKRLQSGKRIARPLERHKEMIMKHCRHHVAADALPRQGGGHRSRSVGWRRRLPDRSRSWENARQHAAAHGEASFADQMSAQLEHQPLP